MKIYAQAYKTYDGARKRMLLERATYKGGYVWGVHTAGVGGPFHVTRQSSKEVERAVAISQALLAFDFDRDEQSP